MKCSSSVKATSGVCAFALSAALACGCLIPMAPAHAITAAEKEAEASDALNQLQAMQTTLEEKSQAYYQSLADYQKAIEVRDATAKRIDELNGEITEIQGRLGERAREMYRHGSTSFLDLLLGATSFDEFTLNWDLLNRVNENDATMSAKSRELREETEAQQVVYTEQAKIAEQKSAEAGAAFKEAEELVNQMQVTYDSLSAEAQQLYALEQQAAANAAANAAGAVTEGGVVNDDGTVTDIATGQVYSSPAEYSAVTGNAIVDRAMAMLGRGYSYGSTGADGMFDCSGLVGYAVTGSYERIGNTTTFMGYNQVSDPQPGDICVNDGHTGIYIGDGQMIHAADENTGVVIGPVQSGMIYVRY